MARAKKRGEASMPHPGKTARSQCHYTERQQEANANMCLYDQKTRIHALNELILKEINPNLLKGVMLKRVFTIMQIWHKEDFV